MSFKKYNKENELLNESKELLGLIAYLAIPLSPVLMKRLGYFDTDVEGYHLSNVVFIDNMTKNQRKKNVHLSCFTIGGPELARLPSQPNIMFKLSGDSLIEGSSDIWTIRSVKGRRWLDQRNRKIYSGNKTTKKLTSVIQNAIQLALNEYGADIDAYQEPEELLKDLQDANLKIKFYKIYLEKLESAFNVHYKLLNKYLKSAANMKYNEIILDNWKILEAYCIDYARPEAVASFKRNKIKYSGVIERKKLSDLSI